MRNCCRLLFLLLIFSLNSSFCQVITNKQKVDDAFAEINSNLSLRFFNALNGNPIPNATITVGELGEFNTDYEGIALFPAENLEDGDLKIIFSHPKYITSEFNVEIMAGTIFFNRFSVSPKLPFGAIRIVIDWDRRPSDLDAHLVKQNDYHISYRNKSITEDGVAKLDRDDRDGYGPETITINKIDENSEYLYYIHDFTNQNAYGSKSLSNSKASVKIYGNEELVNVFQIPEDERGTKWDVFKIVNGQIILINQIND